MTINEIKDFLAEKQGYLKRVLTYYPRDLIAQSKIVRQHCTRPESWHVTKKTLTITRVSLVNSNSSLIRMASPRPMFPV